MKLICLFFFILLSAEGQPAPTIYGKYDRKLNTEYSGGARYIGQIKTHTGRCTASLVGIDLIITAGHCVSSIRTSRDKQIVFYLQEGQGKKAAKSKITRVHTPYHNRKVGNKYSRDFAFLRLEIPLGLEFGYFKLRAIKDARFSHPTLSVSGYSNINLTTHSMYTQNGCFIKEFDSSKKIFYHDCDVGPGDSGAPLYECNFENDCSIYGLHVASEKDWGEVVYLMEYIPGFFANVACSSLNFVSYLKKLQ